MSFSISTVGAVAVSCGSMMTRKDRHHPGKFSDISHDKGTQIKSAYELSGPLGGSANNIMAHQASSSFVSLCSFFAPCMPQLSERREQAAFMGLIRRSSLGSSRNPPTPLHGAMDMKRPAGLHNTISHYRLCPLP